MISEEWPRSIICIKFDHNETLDPNDYHRRGAGSTCDGPRLRTAARFQGWFSRRRLRPLFRELLSSFCSAFNELSFAQFLQGIEHGAASQVCTFPELFFPRLTAFTLRTSGTAVRTQFPVIQPGFPALDP